MKGKAEREGWGRECDKGRERGDKERRERKLIERDKRREKGR